MAPAPPRRPVGVWQVSRGGGVRRPAQRCTDGCGRASERGTQALDGAFQGVVVGLEPQAFAPDFLGTLLLAQAPEYFAQMRGDFGVSYNISKNTPISQLIQSRLPISIRVGGMAVTLGAIVGLVLGIIAALKRDTIFDTLATIISVIGVSVPSYVIALALSYTFGFKLKWFPMLFSAKDVFGSSVLPSISLSMFTMASIARFTRSEMIEVLDSDYMLLAESKGISGPALIFRHALRNALIPIITVLAPLIVDLMTGSLVVEKIFAIPGIGYYFVNSVTQRDYTTIMGVTIFFAAFLMAMVFLVDIFYCLIDPRIKFDA